MNRDGKRNEPEDARRDNATAIRRFARALVGSTAPQAAETIAQEALALAAEAEKRGLDPVERAFAEVVRMNRRRVRPAVAPADAAHDQAGAPDRRDSLPAVIAAMPLDEREILLVVALAQFGYEAAARILELPTSSVVSRLMRARARLDAVHAPSHRIAHLRLVK